MDNGAGLIFGGLSMGCLFLFTLPLAFIIIGIAYVVHPMLAYMVFIGLLLLVKASWLMAKDNAAREQREFEYRQRFQ